MALREYRTRRRSAGARPAQEVQQEQGRRRGEARVVKSLRKGEGVGGGDGGDGDEGKGRSAYARASRVLSRDLPPGTTGDLPRGLQELPSVSPGAPTTNSSSSSRKDGHGGRAREARPFHGGLEIGAFLS
ncbi:hypothetical protein HPP92_009420 [Vanilla planifolia]|uniref:Uncharacterized protein n=1 Tax=Vanilla planifolia TaxID=51239 RepID=A0A835R862_VANPL|nr:hypothetical protein HPP92_009420 [Vanilla planifolia]